MTLILESKLIKADKSKINYDLARNIGIETGCGRTDHAPVKAAWHLYQSGEINKATLMGFLSGYPW